MKDEVLNGRRDDNTIEA